MSGLRVAGLLLLSILPLSAVAQAWTQEAGRVYVRIIQGFASADERYDSDGTVLPYDQDTGGGVRDRSTYLYTELGLTDRLTVSGMLPYKRVTVTDPTFTPTFERRSYAWGDARLGLRYDLGSILGLNDGPAVMALNVAAGLPLGYTRNYRPAVGPGQADLEAMLNVGRSLWPFPGYVQAGAGFRVRTAGFGLSTATTCENGVDDEAHACLTDDEVRRDFGDEFLFSGEAGVALDFIEFQALIDAVWSATAPQAEVVVQPEAFPRRRFVRVGAGVTVRGPAGIGLGVQVFVGAHAQNALKATEWFVGVERHF
ncbi:MAG: hypothetical protein HKN04_09980 [Rhodothermaceae bacterium]|nr:hypothetical protein [Rhodothermaceae bacterium]